MFANPKDKLTYILFSVSENEKKHAKRVILSEDTSNFKCAET